MSLETQLRDLATRVAAEVKGKASADHTHPAPYIVLGASDPVPPGTPDGTLIFRRS